MRDVKLPSGATLKITSAPFADSKALYKALLKEAKGIEISTKTEFAQLCKQVFCAGFSSDEVEGCIWKCLERCLYDSGKGAFKITQDTFEDEKARTDYLSILVEVTKENVGPFMKSLYAEYQRALAMMGENGPA